MALYELAFVAEFDDPGSRAFEFDVDDEPRRFFIVKKDGRFFGYVNSCPHTGAPLNWQGDRFLTADEMFIQCALHGAVFRIHDGHCVFGPCVGDRLTPLPVSIENGRVMIDWSE